MSVLNGSISTALVNLANAPQLKEVPEKIVKLSQELGQFGSRLTGVESQVTGTKNDLSKVQDSLKKLPKKTANNPDVATSNGQVDKVNKLLKETEINKRSFVNLRNKTGKRFSSIGSEFLSSPSACGQLLETEIG